MRDGQVIDRYQSLMNAGRRISPGVTCITGITNAMIAAAPPVARVMGEACLFVSNTPVVAHNASIDKKFWEPKSSRFLRNSLPEMNVKMEKTVDPHRSAPVLLAVNGPGIDRWLNLAPIGGIANGYT